MANTTNLNLEKPIGTDQALVSVINSNSDKIDAFAGSINQALSNKFANLGTLSASTESDFFTEVVNQIKTYANGTYVFYATWQSNSAYVITANKVSDTRIIGSAVPQMQNGKNMVGFSYEGTTLNLYPVALIKTKTVTGTADSNGFFDTGLKTASATLLSVPSLTVNNELRYAFFATPLMNGGTPTEKLAVQFKNWDGNVIGKSATITATIVYIEF